MCSEGLEKTPFSLGTKSLGWVLVTVVAEPCCLNGAFQD